MAYLAGLVIAGIFFLALHYFTELNKSQKLIISASVLSVILSAVAYNKYTSSQREEMMHAVLKFNQGKTIQCNDTDVNSTHYTLSIGTYTFIGKKGSPHYAEMVSASTCQ